MSQTCPTFEDYLASNDCEESFAGLGEVAYIGYKGDLNAPMAATDDTYSTPSFKDGKGLIKIELKEESQKIEGNSHASGKGFTQTGTMVIDKVNSEVSKICRALAARRDWFAIFPDGDDAQILYSPNKKVRVENDGITTTTGAAANDDRIATIAFKLGPVKYPNYFVTPPAGAGGWDSLLASAQASGSSSSSE